MLAESYLDSAGLSLASSTGNLTLSFDADLLDVGRCRDKRAFKRLFEHFAPRLKTYLRKLGSSDELCDDLIQDVMIAVWRRAPQFDPSKAAASTWIYTIARNRRIDVFRRDRHEEVEFDETHQPETAPSSFDLVSTGQMENKIRGAISQLPDKQAELLRVFYFEDKTHSEIADEMKLPLGTVKSRLRLAMVKLRGLIEESDL